MMNGVVWPLAVAQTVVWASTFYLFPALLPAFEAETGWPRTTLTLAFTLSLVMSALASPLSGRLIDAGRGSIVLLGGPVMASFLLLLLSVASAQWHFVAIWAALGVTMAFSLYEPCFAILTKHLGVQVKPWITRITLVAGLAGTVSFPTAGAIALAAGWRWAVIVAAIAILCITIPLTWFALRRLSRHVPIEVGSPDKHVSTTKRPMSSLFWLLAAGFTLLALNHGMLITHILPLLAEKSVADATALLAAAMIGPMQVLGRLVMVATEKRVSTVTSTIWCFGSMSMAALALSLAGANLALIGLFVVLHGAGWGTLSILRPVLTREWLGGTGFGHISGRMSGLMLAGSAVAPFGGALIWQIGGYDLMLTVCLFLTVAALSMLLIARRLQA